MAMEQETGGDGARQEVEALLRDYYRALERGEALDPFYATDEEAGALGPVVKVGSGRGELFVGRTAITAAVRRVTATFDENRVQSRGPMQVRAAGAVAWFANAARWSGRADGKPFDSLTRWTGVCLRTARGWRLLQLHVSEEVD